MSSEIVYPKPTSRDGYRRHATLTTGDIGSTANLIADILDLPEAPPLLSDVVAGHYAIALNNDQARRLAALTKKGTP